MKNESKRKDSSLVLRQAICQALEKRVLYSTAVSTPFLGTPVPAGQIIEAENYDLGGEGVAYHDSTKGNIGKRYRTDDVDIDAGGSNGYNVGNTLAGEWMNYTIGVPATGQYALSASVGAPTAGGTFHALFDGTTLGGEMSLPNTGDWHTFKTVNSSAFNLTAGVHVMRVMIDSNLKGWNAAGNFDYFKLTAQGSTPVTPPSGTSTPFKGTPIVAGQPIEAENYDLGGEGVAYHDTTKGNITKSYRTDDVDIQAGGSNGYNVGSTLAGEWLNYTISVPTTGLYVFSASAGAPANGAKFHAEFDGANLTGSLAVPDSGDWFKFKSVSSGSFNLTAGTHVMRVVIDSNLTGSGRGGEL